MFGLSEDIANIVPLDDSGVPCAFVESDDETVRLAVSDTLERYRDRAEPVSVEGHTH
jgi:hypothetical protein